MRRLRSPAYNFFLRMPFLRTSLIRSLLCGALLAPLLLAPTMVQAEEDEAAAPKEEVMYYTIEPQIITNYLTGDRSIGFIRVQVDIMLRGKKALEAVEHHEPMILNAIIDTLGRQPAWRIKDLNGRDEIRLECFDKIRELMRAETGHDIAQDLLFSEYLYY